MTDSKHCFFVIRFKRTNIMCYNTSYFFFFKVFLIFAPMITVFVVEYMFFTLANGKIFEKNLTLCNVNTTLEF